MDFSLLGLNREYSLWLSTLIVYNYILEQTRKHS
nr:MAG TPA: hypothetical protein [Caudoviricetes sp.]